MGLILLYLDDLQFFLINVMYKKFQNLVLINKSISISIVYSFILYLFNLFLIFIQFDLLYFGQKYILIQVKKHRIVKKIKTFA